MRETDKKNLAIEALKKLINGDVRSQSKRNVTQSKAFSERLEAAIARYHANAITTAQVLEELIQLAKDIRAARARGEETGLTDEEIAFYDALAENESARQVMGEPALRVIAHELGDEHQEQCLGGLDAPGGGARPDAGSGEASASQIRLSARLAGCGGAERPAAGRGVVGGMGGVIHAAALITTLHRANKFAFATPWSGVPRVDRHCCRWDLRDGRKPQAMSRLRSSGEAVTASDSTTAIIALTCAASNQNFSSRSISPSVSSDRCLERHCWNGSHSASGTGRLSNCAWSSFVGTVPSCARSRGIDT